MSGAPACAACLRRAWLLAAVSPRLERAFRARDALRDVLALEDSDLIDAVAPRDGHQLRRRHAAFDVADARRAADRAGLVTRCPHGSGHPALLGTGPGAPRALFVAGDVDRLAAWLPEAGEDDPDGADVDPPAVAVVGTRNASEAALEVARTLGRGLAASGVVVVSGMALGVDAAAHAGALEVGGPTVAVLAGGADVAYPASKRALHRRLVAEGLVVSEMPPGTQPLRWCFPARNRTIAGLARCTVVVEAAERSGSLITADFAQALGRDVAAVPGAATSRRTRGSNGLLREGAHVVLGVEDVLDLVGRPVAPTAASAGAGGRRDGGSGSGGSGSGGPQQGQLVAAVPADLERDLPGARLLVDRVAAGEDSVGALARTPQEADAVLEALAALELAGVVKRAPGGRYVVCGPTYPRSA